MSEQLTENTEITETKDEVLTEPAEELHEPETEEKGEDLTSSLPDLLSLFSRISLNPLNTPLFVEEKMASLIDTYIVSYLATRMEDDKVLTAMCDDIRTLLLNLPELIHGINFASFVHEAPGDIETAMERCRWLTTLESRQEPLLFYPAMRESEHRLISKNNAENLRNLTEVFSNVLETADKYKDDEGCYTHIVKPFVISLIYPVFSATYGGDALPMDQFEAQPSVILPIYSRRYALYATPRYEYTSALKALKEKEGKEETTTDKEVTTADKEAALADETTPAMFRDCFRVVGKGDNEALEILDEDKNWQPVLWDEGNEVSKVCYRSVIDELLEYDNAPDAVYTVQTKGGRLTDAVRNVSRIEATIGSKSKEDKVEVTFFNLN